jgi:hypothetical protein
MGPQADQAGRRARDSDDVQDVVTNADISDEIMAELDDED